MEQRFAEGGLRDVYVCSLSAKSLIYKGMFLAESIDAFYPDLRDPRFESAVAIFHQRYSTNTFPEWRLAQPFRMLAHNGEINTPARQPQLDEEPRDPNGGFRLRRGGRGGEAGHPARRVGLAALDNTFEVLVRAGRSAPMAKTLLMPEAASPHMQREHAALFAYANAVMEPWDGPAAVCASDGRWVVAGKDRNGLRPLRVARTSDGLLIVGSEAGMSGVADSRIVEKTHIQAGRMIAVDLEAGKFYGEDAVLDDLAAAHPMAPGSKTSSRWRTASAPAPSPAGMTRRSCCAARPPPTGRSRTWS